MHGINLSVIPEIKDGMRLLSADGDLGGMRNLLPLSSSSMFGAGKDPHDLRNLMRKLSARISRETGRRNDANTQAEENPNLPSGYTYLLQFIAHDMVNTSISLAATEGRRFGFQNARQQPLTLDTIYGGGPDVTPQAYEFSRLCAQSRGFMPRTRLRCGRVRDRSGATTGMPFADIGRAAPIDVKDDGIPDRGSAACCLRTEALVADPRNEDQALVAQITLLFHRMHNFVLDQMDIARPPVTAPDAYLNFICARYIMTLFYRKIIVKDVLYRLLDPSVYRYYFLPAIDKTKLVSPKDAWGRIPVEFSHGAFRCGHAMVRNSYRVKGDEALESGRAMQFNSRRSPAFTPLSEDWVVKWEQFFEIGNAKPKNYSRRLRPDFSSLARSEFFFPPLISNADGNGDATGLPNRDLVSAVFARIWSVPKLIDALRASSTELPNFLPAYDEHVPALTSWLKATADPGGITEQFEPEDIVAIAEDPPLPFFVLYEADVKHDGQRLGPLGSIIIAETMVGAMESYPLQVAQSTFDPVLQLKEQSERFRRLGVSDDALAMMPEIESFEELLIFMQANGLLENEQ
jgi:heme peroxidase